MKYLVGSLQYKIKDLFNSNTNLQKELRANGVVLIQNFLTDNDCESFKESINELIGNENYSWKDSEDSDFRIFGFENMNTKSVDIFQKLETQYASYVSRKTLEKTLMANFVKFKENNKGSGGGWHRDSLNRRQLKFMVYLSDVNEDNGPFQYLKGSHVFSSKFRTNGAGYKKVRYTQEEISKYSRSWPLVNCIGKKGSCVVFDSSGLHRGSPLKHGNRYAITQYMFDSTMPKHISQMILTDKR